MQHTNSIVYIASYLSLYVAKGEVGGEINQEERDLLNAMQESYR